MDLYDRLAAALEADGPAAALAALVEDRTAAGDFQAVFYARLAQARLGFGAPPFPDGPAADIPAEHHDAYEEAIRVAGREAGKAHLQRGEFPQGWAFYRMLGEPEPARQALDAYQPGPDDDVSPAVEVAWHHAVHPERGFDLILARHGLCPAITAVQSADLSARPAVRDHCVRALVRALHGQLAEHLPAAGDEAAVYTDPSHLLSVAQLSLHLTGGPEVELARQLCDYGTRIDPELRGRDDPPFQDTYADYAKYLGVVGGADVEGGLAHFRAKCEAGAAEGYRFPAEVLVTLLDRAGRTGEALAVARQHLADADERSLTCPGPTALARKLGDFRAAAEVARGRGDAVGYVVSMIAAGGR
jgi:hypothetical protein